MARGYMEAVGGQEVERLVAEHSGLIVIVYEIWDGPTRDDPASTVQLRAAFYDDPDVIPDVANAVELQLGKRQYSSWWEGLPEAIEDTLLKLAREEDAASKKAYEQHGKLMRDPATLTGYHQMRDKREAEDYQEFLAAIEAVAVDENDDASWKVIDKWRARQLRAEEREEVTA